MKKVCFLLVLSLLCFTSCKKDGSTSSVYVAGGYSTANAHFAAYWKNGKLISVTPEGKYSTANGIAVVGATVFLVGLLDDKPCYWKDGIRTNLMAATWFGIARDIKTENGTLYISGTAKLTAQGIDLAFLWMVSPQGVVTAHQLESIASSANRLVCKGATCYIAGQIDNNPCYWKWDGTTVTRVDLGPNAGEATGIALQGSTVYTVGNYNTGVNAYPCYWKGTSIYTFGFLYPSFNMYGIGFSLKNELVIVGYSVDASQKVRALIWEGEVLNDRKISNEQSFANSIFYSGNDQYISGLENGAACYWKNGSKVDLKTLQSEANDIVVQ
jgi:hypothetical protein